MTPLHPIVRTHFATYLLAADEYEGAVAQLLQVLELDPDFLIAHAWLASAYSALGRWTDARHHAERMYALAPIPLSVGVFAGCLARVGELDRATSLMTPLGESNAPGTLMGVAFFHLSRGEADEALTWIARAIERGECVAMLPLLLRLSCSSSARWPAVARMLKLPGEPRRAFSVAARAASSE